MPLRFVPDALAAGIPPDDARRLFEKIAWLWTHRKETQHTALKANLTGFLKRRLGDYRIIYTYDSEADDLAIRLIDRRENIYKEMAKRSRRSPG